MKISNTTTNYINQTYANQTNAAAQNEKTFKAAEEAAAAKATDSINLSARTRELQKIAGALETPDAEREKYVADIKQKVDSGTYDLNVDAVAEKMAKSLGRIDEII